MTSRLISSAAPAAGVLLALGLVGGCSGDDQADGGPDRRSAGEADPVARVQDAAGRTLELSSFTVESDARITLQQQVVGMSIDGSVDYAKAVGDVQMAFEQEGRSTDLHIKLDGTNAWVAASGPQMPPFPDGATWLEGEAEMLASSSSFEPTGLIGLVLVLEGVTEVEELGSDQIDGDDVDRYRTRLTYQEALDGAGDRAEDFSSSFSLTGSAAAADLIVEVALDADGVVRELEIDIDSDLPVDGDLTLSLSDPGAEVEVPQRPDPKTVASGPEARALLQTMIV